MSNLCWVLLAAFVLQRVLILTKSRKMIRKKKITSRLTKLPRQCPCLKKKRPKKKKTEQKTNQGGQREIWTNGARWVLDSKITFVARFEFTFLDTYDDKKLMTESSFCFAVNNLPVLWRIPRSLSLQWPSQPWLGPFFG